MADLAFAVNEIFFQNLWRDEWLVAVVVLIAVALGRRYQVEDISPRRRYFLIALRGVSFALVLFALQNPQLISSETVKKQKDIVLLVDDSLSMEVASGTTTRWEKALSATDAIRTSPLRDKFRMPVVLTSHDKHHHVGDAGAVPGPILGGVEPSGTRSRLSESVIEQIQRHDKSRLTAIVLLSDGRDTDRYDWTRFQSAGVPVHTLLPAPDDQPLDQRVLDILAPRTCRRMDDIPVVTRLARSDPSVDVRVSLSLDGRVVDEKIWMAGEGLTGDVSFSITMKDPGWKTLTCRIENDDAIPSNDSREHLVEVSDRPLKILLAAGSPGYDFRYLRESMVRDDAIELTVLLQDAHLKHPGWGKRKLEEFPRTLSQWLEYDVAILIDLDASRVNDSCWRSMSRWVEEAQGALLVQAGRINGFPMNAAHSPLGSLLPIVPDDALSDPGGFSLAAGEDSALLDDLLQEEDLPFYWSAGVKRAKNLSRTILLADDMTTSEGSPLPAVSWIRQGRGKVGWVGLANLWRLRLNGGDDVHTGMYTSFARFLSEDRYAGQNKRVRIRIGDEGRVLKNRPAPVSISVYDKRFNPVDLVSLSCVMTSPLGESSTVIIPASSAGQYQTHATFTEAGRHTLAFEVDGQSFVWNFLVQTPQDEYVNPVSDRLGMRQLSESTGGTSGPWTTDATRALIDRLMSLPDEQLRQRSVPLWNHPLFGALLLAALVLEWFFRRKWNLA